MSNPYGKRPQQLEEVFTPFSELCRYADEYHLIIELDKPFKEFEEIMLKVVNTDGNILYQVTLDDIASVNEQSARLLNELSKQKNRR